MHDSHVPSRPDAEPLSDSPVVRLFLMGTDVLAAMRPATPVQLAHACLRLGYHSVIPASWGDELVAAAYTRELSRRGGDGGDGARPVVLAACPQVARRVLSTGEELRDLMIAVAPPPVALARYLRALAGERPLHITWCGECPAATDTAIDARVSGEELAASLRAAGIDATAMPMEFEDVLPPDRRRHFSQAGGTPTHAAIGEAAGGWMLVELAERELSTALAEMLLSDEALVVDLAPRVGCRCAGSTGDCGNEARDAIALMEPPRASAPVVDHSVHVDLSYDLPAAVVLPPDARVRVGRTEPVAGTRDRDEPGNSPMPDAVPRHRPSPQPRAIVGTTPTTRTPEGRSLPRAYVSRRRSTPRPGQMERVDPQAGMQAGGAAGARVHAPADAEGASPTLLYGGHSGPLGRLARPDREATPADEALHSHPIPAGEDSTGGRVARAFTRRHAVMLIILTGVAGAIAGTLLGWLIRG